MAKSHAASLSVAQRQSRFLTRALMVIVGALLIRLILDIANVNLWNPAVRYIFISSEVLIMPFRDLAGSIFSASSISQMNLLAEFGSFTFFSLLLLMVSPVSLHLPKRHLATKPLQPALLKPALSKPKMAPAMADRSVQNPQPLFR